MLLFGSVLSKGFRQIKHILYTTWYLLLIFHFAHYLCTKFPQQFELTHIIKISTNQKKKTTTRSSCVFLDSKNLQVRKCENVKSVPNAVSAYFSLNWSPTHWICTKVHTIILSSWSLHYINCYVAMHYVNLLINKPGMQIGTMHNIVSRNSE